VASFCEEINKPSVSKNECEIYCQLNNFQKRLYYIVVISSDFMPSTVLVCGTHKEGQSEATGQTHGPSRALP